MNMGFFRNLAGPPVPDPDEERIRAYLAEGQSGPRTDWLFWGVVNTLVEADFCASERFGDPLSGPEQAVSEAVAREVMRQDRDLAGTLVRKSAVNLQLILGALGVGAEEAFSLGFGAVGLRPPVDDADIEHVGDAADHLNHVEREGAAATAGLLLAVMRARALPPPHRLADAGWRLYVNFYTDRPGDATERLAYSLVGFGAVLIARLRSADRIETELPVFEASWKHVPALTEAGWYPNPSKHGDIVDGIPAFQRYWDDGAWTPRVRIRRGREWRVGSMDLHQPPDD